MVIGVLAKVFRKPAYSILALATSITVFALAVWLPNFSLLVWIMGHPGISLAQKFDLPISLLGSIATNFTLLSASYTMAIAILFGINIAMMVFYLRRRVAAVKSSGVTMGFLGLVSGALGMGCAACGSLLLTSGLSLLAASSILAWLPLGGSEFGILGVILLMISIYIIAKQIQNPAVCRINP